MGPTGGNGLGSTFAMWTSASPCLPRAVGEVLRPLVSSDNLVVLDDLRPTRDFGFNKLAEDSRRRQAINDPLLGQAAPHGRLLQRLSHRIMHARDDVVGCSRRCQQSPP